MKAVPLNSPDLSKVPDQVWTDLCGGAISMALRHRDDPGYKERFEKWLAEQGKGGK